MLKKIIAISLIQLLVGFGLLIAFRIGGFSVAAFFLGPTQVFLLLIPMNLIWVIFNIILILGYRPKNKMNYYCKWFALGFTVFSGVLDIILPYFYIVAASNLQILIFVIWFLYFFALFICANYAEITKMFNKKNQKSTSK